MTKADLIVEVSRVVEITRKEAEAIVETILGSIVDGLHEGDKVEIRGFGSFRTRQRAGHIGRNPKTGESVEVEILSKVVDGRGSSGVILNHYSILELLSI